MNMTDLLDAIRRMERRPDNLECLLIAVQNMANDMYRCGDDAAGGVSDAITDALVDYENSPPPSLEELAEAFNEIRREDEAVERWKEQA